ncbi:MAG TPA: hypothetical protein VM070_02890 [Candidatus Saccharimonadales bacterium]|nr:hypothetical protein [Candidatus Saccharimonadales bacterium]
MSRATAYATGAAAVLVVLAILAGSGASRLRSVPPPSPSRPAVIPSAPTATEAPDTGPLVFVQPLSAGCAAGEGVYVVSDGGGIGRFDGEHWQLIDPTLRSLVAVACRGTELIAVGGAGGVVTIDDQARSIRTDAVQLDDLRGISLLPDGALAAGRRGSVVRRTAAGWFPHAAGLEEDLESIVAFDPLSAWVVGAGGVTYRLERAGWRAIPSGTAVTLRAVVGAGADAVVAVGDAGTILRSRGGVWEAPAAVPPGRGDISFRAAALIGSSTWIVGDRGSVVRLDGGAETAVDLGTTCTLRAVFAHRGMVWIVGSDGTRAGVWRIAAGTVRQWGACP